MKLKKGLVIVLALGMLTAMSTTAFAHGHGGRHHGNSRSYSICSVEDCNLTYNHSHNGTTYAGHHNEDGHDHYYY